MKKAVIISFLAVGLTACGNSAPVTPEQVLKADNANVSTPQNANSLVASSHSTDKTEGKNSTQNGASKNQTESPMAKPIDVSEFTKNIETYEKQYRGKPPQDIKAKMEWADAYFQRAFALTEAAQYRAALGDFRKGLKLNPKNTDAREMHDRIIEIFKSINREPPKEGEEPPPMTFNKGG